MSSKALRYYVLAAVTLIVWGLAGALWIMGRPLPVELSRALEGTLFVWLGAVGTDVGTTKKEVKP